MCGDTASSFTQRRHCHSTSREDLVAALRTLGITTLSSGGGFTQGEIKKKYYALAKAHHPDTKSDKTKSSSSQVKGPDMSVVNDAHATIAAYFKSGGSAAGLKAALQSSSSSGSAGRGGASAGHPHQYSYSDFVYGADSQGYAHGSPFPGHPFGSGGGGPYDDYESSFFAGYSGPDYHQFYSNGPGGASNTSSSSSQQQQHAGGPGQGPHNTYQDPFGGQNPHDFGAGTGTGGFWDGFAEYGYGGPGGDFDNEPPPFEFVTEEDFIRYGGFTADGPGPGGPSGAEAFAEFFSDRGGRRGGRGGRGERAGRGRGHDFQSQTAQHVYGSWRDVDADELRRNGRNGGAGAAGGGYKSYGPSGDAPPRGGSAGPYDPWPQDYESGQVDESGMPYGGDSQRGGHRGREMDGRHFVVEDENGETFVFTQGPNGGPRMYGPDGVCEDIPWEALHDDIREAYVYSQQQHSPGGNRSQRQHSKKKDGAGARKRRQEKREQQNRQSQNQSSKTSSEGQGGSSSASGKSSSTESSGGQKSGEGDRRLSGFTDVEVEALQHMHRDGKSFKFISEAMERPLNDILEAFNALNDQQAATGASSDQQKQKRSTNQTGHGASGGDNKNHRRDGSGGGKNHRHTTGGQSHGRTHPQRPVGSVKTGHSAHGPGGRPQYASTQDPTAASMADEFYGDFDGHQHSSRPAPHHKKQYHQHKQRYHNKGKQGDMHVDGIPVSFVELDDNGQPIRPRNKNRHQNQNSSGNHNNHNKHRRHSSHGTRGPAHSSRTGHGASSSKHHRAPTFSRNSGNNSNNGGNNDSSSDSGRGSSGSSGGGGKTAVRSSMNDDSIPYPFDGRPQVHGSKHADSPPRPQQ